MSATPTDAAPLGVLVMAYGTPKDREHVEEYYTDIRRGNPPPQHLLDELLARYDAIGGT
ncbi:MAG: protoporphyrin/coproporphyrin ferrochelatase, partial [Frankiaceae bacterium]|nr:protoporphyrin/coproporphyrin ferrochelatase [Frankiaceae bacterium]